MHSCFACVYVHACACWVTKPHPALWKHMHYWLPDSSVWIAIAFPFLDSPPFSSLSSPKMWLMAHSSALVFLPGTLSFQNNLSTIPYQNLYFLNGNYMRYLEKSNLIFWAISCQNEGNFSMVPVIYQGVQCILKRTFVDSNKSLPGRIS